MDQLAKKKNTVVRLRISNRTYLMACDDQKSLALITTSKSLSDNTLWTLKSCNNQSFHIVSIYGKLLAKSRTAYKSTPLHTVIQMDESKLMGANSSKSQFHVRWKIKETEKGFPNVEIRTFDGETPFYLYLLPAERTVVATKIPGILHWYFKRQAEWVIEILDTIIAKKKEQLEPEQSSKNNPKAEPSAIVSNDQQLHPKNKSEIEPKRGQVFTPSTLQVGQVVFHNYSHTKISGDGQVTQVSNLNTGYNYNASGTQTIGDVTVNTKIGKHEGMIVNFYQP